MIFKCLTQTTKTSENLFKKEFEAQLASVNNLPRSFWKWIRVKNGSVDKGIRDSVVLFQFAGLDIVIWQKAINIYSLCVTNETAEAK